jgi:hypothetical protein
VETGVVNIINNGTEERSYEIDLPENDTFTFADSPDGGTLTGTVKPHDAAKITFSANSDSPGAHSLDVIVKAGDSVQSVTLSTTVSGATLAIDPLVANFGDVRQNQTSDPIKAVFTNNGNVPLTISSFDGLDTSQFQIVPSTVVIKGGESTTANITMLGAGANSTQVSEVLTPKFESGTALCGQIAPTLTLQGTRVSTNVIVSPLTADFGSPDCNTTPTTSSVITLTNYDPTNAVPYSFSLANMTAFKVADSGGGSIPHLSGGTPGKTTLTITANNTGAAPGPVNTSLSVTVTPSDTGPKTYNIPVTMKVMGAVLQWDTTKLTFDHNNQKLYGSLENTGNATACLFFDTTDSHFSPTGFTTVSGASKSNVSVTFRPNVCKTDYSGSIRIQQGDCFVDRSAAICNSLPTLPVAGKDDCN